MQQTTERSKTNDPTPSTSQWEATEHATEGQGDQEHRSLPSTSEPSEPLTTPMDISDTNVSERKLRTSAGSVKSARENWSGYRLIDIDLFFSVIEDFVSCGKCSGPNIKFKEEQITGLNSVFSITCLSCGWNVELRNGEKIGKDQKVAEINRRSVFAFKTLGLGHSALKQFCALMDLPPPVSAPSFGASVDQMELASQSVAQESMMRAAAEEEEKTGNNKVTVSGDGTWHKRGFTSVHGVVSLIGLLTGKVIDFIVLSLVCKICDLFPGPKTGQAFQEHRDQHKERCTRNHEGSSGKMEADGVLAMFQRSVASRGLIYEQYIGDGDSKAFLSVSKDQPYGDQVVIKKLECTAHVKKRMGTRLRNLKKSYAGKKLSDGKSLSGKGRLTDKIIDEISYYYGVAIKTSKTVAEMKQAVWAIFHHLSATDSNPSHQFCPAGSTSWCKYKKAESEGKLTSLKHKRSVPLVVMEAARKVFEDLTSDELLNRCIGGFTQNPNESFNSILWQYCPKSKHVGSRTVNIAACEAVIHFNDGQGGKCRVMEALDIAPGKYCVNWCVEEDKKRCARASLLTPEAKLAQRKAKRSRERLAEDESYVPGGF